MSLATHSTGFRSVFPFLSSPYGCGHATQNYRNKTPEIRREQYGGIQKKNPIPIKPLRHLPCSSAGTKWQRAGLRTQPQTSSAALGHVCQSGVWRLRAKLQNFCSSGCKTSPAPRLGASRQASSSKAIRAAALHPQQRIPEKQLPDSAPLAPMPDKKNTSSAEPHC